MKKIEDTEKIKGEEKVPERELKVDRRTLLKGALAGAATTMLPLNRADASFSSFWESFFQKHFREMTDAEKKKVVERLEREYERKYKKAIKVGIEPAMPGVLFGYGLDLSRCIGCRTCVYACVAENNQSKDPQVQWIQVLRFKQGELMNWEKADKYYDPKLVPEPGYFYMPVQCQQCENPPCVRACPTQATWKEPDGIVVVDYNWCIGCRYCMAACPYGARHFNWAEPGRKPEDINPNTHYLGNRPRYKGVVEKCTFCVQRTRKGRYTACVEACPVGARKFGNLLDPKSEIRYAMEHKRTFRLKDELNTHPKFFYFFDFEAGERFSG
ncbi:MAG: 4Fe-4S dicluster domain-containing protein [Nitrospiraceae bacterium]|nr:4Fe-4S dicluster domain-containing protein [Nitrospiraceae bacterium]